MTYVLLINREVGLAQTAYPVCGKSGKAYGVGAPDPIRSGVTFKMSIDDYERDKWDILGNRAFGQVWIPEFVVESEPVDPLAGMRYNEMFVLAKQKGAQVHFGITKPDLIDALRKAA